MTTAIASKVVSPLNWKPCESYTQSSAMNRTGRLLNWKPCALIRSKNLSLGHSNLWRIEHAFFVIMLIPSGGLQIE